MDSMNEVDISEKVTFLDKSTVLYKDFVFEVFKKNRKNKHNGSLFDVYCCEEKNNNKCKVRIRRDCSSRRFFVMKVHERWEHSHKSRIVEERREEKRKKELEFKLKKKEDVHKTPLPSEEVFYDYLPSSGFFRVLPESAIMMISCFIEYEDLFILRESSEYLRHVLKRDFFFRMYSKEVFRRDFEEIKNAYLDHISRTGRRRRFRWRKEYKEGEEEEEEEEEEPSPHEILEHYYKNKYIPQMKKEESKLLDELQEVWDTDTGNITAFKIPNLLNTKKLFKKAVRKNPKFIHIKSFERYKNEKELIIATLEPTEAESYRWATREVRKDLHVSILTLKQLHKKYGPLITSILRTWFSNYILRNPKFFIEAIRLNPMCFYEAPDEIQRMKKVVIEAVSRKYSILLFVDEDLKNDEDVRQASCGHN